MEQSPDLIYPYTNQSGTNGDNRSMPNQNQQNQNQQQGQMMQNQNSQNQSQKIQNPETQIPKTPQMNDRDFANDLLSMEKLLTDSYCTFLNEASNQGLYQDLLAIFTETQNEQRQLYNLMFKKGWYALEPAEQQKVQQSYQQFQGYTSQFPYGGQTLQ